MSPGELLKIYRDMIFVCLFGLGFLFFDFCFFDTTCKGRSDAILAFLGTVKGVAEHRTRHGTAPTLRKEAAIPEGCSAADKKMSSLKTFSKIKGDSVFQSFFLRA